MGWFTGLKFFLGHIARVRMSDGPIQIIILGHPESGFLTRFVYELSCGSLCAIIALWSFQNTGGYTFYYKKYLKENLFMWSHMQKTFILLHIRAMNFRSKFVEIGDHVSKLKFYYIENSILLKTFQHNQWLFNFGCAF